MATLDAVLRDVAQNPCTSMGVDLGTLKSVWRAFCSYIGDQMLSAKGVSVPGFCTFSLNKAENYANPSFILLPAWCSTFGVQASPSVVPPRTAGPTPQGVINWVVVASNAAVSKEVATNAIKDIGRKIGEAATRGSVRIDFGICGVEIASRRYHVVWDPQFLNAFRGALGGSFRAGYVRGGLSPETESEVGARTSRLQAARAASATVRPVAPSGPAMGGFRRPGTGASQRSGAADQSPLPAIQGHSLSGGYEAEEDLGPSASQVGRPGYVAYEPGMSTSQPGPMSASEKRALFARQSQLLQESMRHKKSIRLQRKQARADRFHGAWDRQIAQKKQLEALEVEADRAQVELTAAIAEEEAMREEDKGLLRKQQQRSVAATNAALAVERAKSMRHKGEPMGDLFVGRKDPEQTTKDLNFLKRQIAEKKEREQLAAQRGLVAQEPVDLAAERRAELEEKRMMQESQRLTYDQQIAEKIQLGPHLEKARDDQANFFFKNKGAAEVVEQEREEKLKKQAIQRANMERNQRELRALEEAKRSQQAEDAQRERDLYLANKAVDEERQLKEKMRQHRQKADLLKSWKQARSEKEQEQAREKEMFRGWKDALPFKNDSSDDED